MCAYSTRSEWQLGCWHILPFTDRPSATQCHRQRPIASPLSCRCEAALQALCTNQPLQHKQTVAQTTQTHRAPCHSLCHWLHKHTGIVGSGARLQSGKATSPHPGRAAGLAWPYGGTCDAPCDALTALGWHTRYVDDLCECVGIRAHRTLLAAEGEVGGGAEACGNRCKGNSGSVCWSRLSQLQPLMS